MAVKKEVIWLISSTSLNITSVFLVFIFLAQLGGQELVGELAIINIVLSFTLLLQDSGLSNYFIHRQNLTRSERSSLFFINILLGSIATISVFLLSGWVGDFYHSENIARCLSIVAFNFIFISLTSQYQAHFIKNLENTKLAKIEIATKLWTLICMIGLYYLGHPPLDSYIWAVLCSTVFKWVVILYLVPREWHPRFTFDNKILSPALSFGGYQMGSQVLNQFRGRLDQVIIGKWLGTDALGLYTIAKELVLQPNKLISPLISRIILPRLAKNQSNDDEFSKVFSNSNNYILIFNTFIFVLMTVCLYFLIPILYGDDFSSAFDLFIIMVVIGMVRPLGSIFGALAQSKGRSKIEFKWNILSFVVVSCFMFIATFFKDILTYAVLMSAAQVMLSSYAVFFFSRNLIQLDYRAHLLRIGSILSTYLLLQIVFFYW